MAIFGDKFYKKLGGMSPWRQSLFALALAHRQSPNFMLWASLAGRAGAAAAFAAALGKMWEYHLTPDNRVNLDLVLAGLEPCFPETDDASPFGAYAALDACFCLEQAIRAVTDHTGGEAEQASGASAGTAARYLETVNETEYAAEDLYDEPVMRAEMDFQVDMLEKIARAERSPGFCASIREICLGLGCSGIGISAD